MLDSLLTGLRGQAAMHAEILTFRHQLTVLHRNQKPKRLVLYRGDPLPMGLAGMILAGLAFRSSPGILGGEFRQRREFLSSSL